MDLIVLAKHSSVILNIHGHREKVVLLYFSGHNLSSLPFSTVWAIGILYIAFIIMRYAYVSPVSLGLLL